VVRHDHVAPLGRALGVLSAALVELPLAIICGWIALHVDQVVERRLRRLARRADRLQARLPAVAAPAKVRAAEAGAAAAELGRPGVRRHGRASD
jgi:HAMP domain-containing protein